MTKTTRTAKAAEAGRGGKPGGKSGKGGDSGWWIIGAVLVVQGFGSAVTEAAWDTSFGVSALLREADVPVWGTLLVGVAGLAVLGVAARRRAAKRRAGHGS